MGIQQDALFGDDEYMSMGATMLNPSAASSETDWGAVLANGIRGAAQGAIQARVQGAYQSGQLQYQQQQRASANRMITWLLIGAVVYAVVK